MMLSGRMVSGPVVRRQADGLLLRCSSAGMMGALAPPGVRWMVTRRKPAAAAAAGHERPQVALVLQGGGALGAYHIGAYEALHEAGVEPDWIAGISIGAINACVLAGNGPADRLARLETLWDEISRPGGPGAWLRGPWRVAYNRLSFLEAVCFGQPNFWVPRFPGPLLRPEMSPEQASWCDIAPMRETLARLANFGRISGGGIRLSLGATCVTTGELVFFDNRRETITADHVLASGALPPGFAATRVGDRLYWDGGCVSNTPLEAIYRDPGPGHTVVYMVDLFDAQGPAPTDMDGVAWRSKQIQYASRSTHQIRQLAAAHNQAWALHQLARDGVDVGGVCDGLDLAAGAGACTFEIVHVIYHPGGDEIPNADAEFSRASIATRRAAGLADMRQALAGRPRQAGPPRRGTTVRTVRSAPAG
jgi:NTE family protein